MSGIATAVVASAVIGGAVASRSAGKAADAQRDASQLASSTELEMFEQNRADQEPWRQAGIGALGQLTAGTNPGGEFSRDFTLADFNADPGYDFRMREGQKAFERSAAARGGALGGQAIKGGIRYGQEFASGEFSNAYNRFNNNRTQRFNRLSSLAGIGQTATRDVAQQGAQVAGRVGENMVGAGNAQASSYVARGNAINQVGTTLGNFAMQQQYMPQRPIAGFNSAPGGGYTYANPAEVGPFPD